MDTTTLLYYVGSIALFILATGLQREAYRNWLLKKQKEGPCPPWGCLNEIGIIFVSVFPITAIIASLISIVVLYYMGADAKLCWTMPKELCGNDNKKNPPAR